MQNFETTQTLKEGAPSLSTNTVKLANDGHGEHRASREAGDGADGCRECGKLYLDRIGSCSCVYIGHGTAGKLSPVAGVSGCWRVERGLQGARTPFSWLGVACATRHEGSINGCWVECVRVLGLGLATGLTVAESAENFTWTELVRVRACT